MTVLIIFLYFSWASHKIKRHAEPKIHFTNKNKQTFNERLCSVRKVFDKHNLISGLHSFLSKEDEKYNKVLPPLSLLTKEEEKKMMSELENMETEGN